MSNYRKHKLYEGSNKIIYQSNEESLVILFFKDNLRISKDNSITILGKGVINNSISSYIMNNMETIGINTHFIEKKNMREQLVQLVDILPVKIVLNNIAYGDYASKFGIEEGYVFNYPLVEFLVKNSKGEIKTINENQIMSFNWLTRAEIDLLVRQSIRINDFISGIFIKSDMRLVSAELEFGRAFNGEDFILTLADAVTPETCRIWDIYTNNKLDYESIVNDNVNPIEIYKEVAKRLKIL